MNKTTCYKLPKTVITNFFKIAFNVIFFGNFLLIANPLPGAQYPDDCQSATLISPSKSAPPRTTSSQKAKIPTKSGRTLRPRPFIPHDDSLTQYAQMILLSAMQQRPYTETYKPPPPSPVNY